MALVDFEPTEDTAYTVDVRDLQGLPESDPFEWMLLPRLSRSGGHGGRSSKDSHNCSGCLLLTCVSVKL